MDFTKMNKTHKKYPFEKKLYVGKVNNTSLKPTYPKRWVLLLNYWLVRSKHWKQYPCGLKLVVEKILNQRTGLTKL